MNEVLRSYLKKFLLVFFNDILIYSQSIEEHWCGNKPKKIEAMQNWPSPKDIKALRGGGEGVRFVRGYKLMTKPLIELLKKKGIHWTNDA
ncbi:putative mitochondrial protein, partial [Mucuna pruriens]